jgi:hypothetical protein
MNPEMNPENTISALSATEPSVATLHKELQSLRLHFSTLLILLLVVNAIFALFIARQFLAIRRQSVEIKQAYNDYKQNVEPKIKDVALKLWAFGQTHPDFAPIIAKYPPPDPTPAEAQPATLLPTKK